MMEAPASRTGEILSELQNVLDSNAFRTSLRAREFLSYVVHEALEGNSEALKERSIGVNLYHRPATYFTGEDPVVRVKAAEVRRRLSKHYAESETSNVRIELPVGSYVPQFRIPDLPAAVVPSLPDATPGSVVEIPAQAPTELPPVNRRPLSRASLQLLFFLVVVIAALAFALLRPVSLSRSFWGPLLSSNRPILVCVPAPVSYALSSEVMKRMSAPALANDDSELVMNTKPIQLDPEANVKGKEITPLVDYYVNKDDAYVISGLSKIFTKLGQDDELRIGKDLTFADLRSSPAVLVGAYNNPWTLKVSADLPYEFREIAGLPLIQEKANPSQIFRPESDGRLGTRDFAIVARLLSSKTGQPLVIIAGTGMVGTEAAGRMLCDEAALKAALSKAPKDWNKKNLELVLETDQVDGSSSQPHVVRLKSW